MPYVITTTTLPDNWARMGPDVVTRHAVATLDEARAAAYAIYGPVYESSDASANVALAAHPLPEQGGTIGPLPDGTVIEVTNVERHVLAVHLGLTPREASWTNINQLIAEYNAAV